MVNIRNKPQLLLNKEGTIMLFPAGFLKNPLSSTCQLSLQSVPWFHSGKGFSGDRVLLGCEEAWRVSDKVELEIQYPSGRAKAH